MSLITMNIILGVINIYLNESHPVMKQGCISLVVIAPATFTKFTLQKHITAPNVYLIKQRNIP